MQTTREVRVTYLITTRNRAEFLERTLANVREFITPEDELIIIDGLSTDHTREVVERNRDLVTLFLSEKDFGEAHAVNKGLFRMRGRLIKAITDDDYFYPDAMRELIRQMETHPDVDAMLCGGEVCQMQDGQPVLKGIRFLPLEVEPTADALYDHTTSGLGLIFRKTAAERIGGVSSNYVSVDGDLMVRLIECQCTIRYLDVKLYKWFVHPHSGIHKTEEIRRDRLLFSVRLGRWEEVFCYDPESLADIIQFRVKPGGLSWLYGIWVTQLIARRPLRWSLFAAGKSLKFFQSLKARLRKLHAHGKPATPPQQIATGVREHQWSGVLR
jgi:glycosyltransferase involved in cell wall biosynthesis